MLFQIGILEIAKILLDNGANIDALDLRGETLLMYVTKKGYLPAKLLLAEGTDVNKAYFDGTTALMFMVGTEHIM